MAQQQGLGQAGPLEGRQVQALVGTVRPGVGVFHPGDEDLRVREETGVGGDEGDGSARAGGDGQPPPGLF